MWTNRKEFSAYAEQFNAQAENKRILVRYVEEPAEKYETVGPGKKAPDIVIGENLTTSKLIDSFATLQNLFTEGPLDSSRFYSPPLEQGVYERQHVLLPVSFTLPLIIFDKDTSTDGMSRFFITAENLKKLSISYNTGDEHGLEKLGFSPLWKEEFLFTFTLLSGARFHETETGHLAWNGQAIDETLNFMRNWVVEGNGGLEAEREFRKKYLFEPPHTLIEHRRIRFYYHDISSFYSIPVEKRDYLEFRWPAKNEKIPVLPSVLYMGIPHGAQGIETAKTFIKWFFQADIQEKLLRASEYKRVRSFGIVDGFSSLPRVNEEVMPRVYPFLVGHIPKESYLSFPSPVPLEWEEIRRQVIEPWLENSVRNPDDTGTLSKEVEMWLRRQPAN